jgi:hypothetical protein
MTKKTTDIFLRAFGMSGAQLISGLEELEEVQGHNILPNAGVISKNRELSGYDQFESDVRSAASDMSEYYEIFYCLEVSIRRLIANTLHSAEGAEWWDSSRVGDELKKYVRRVQAEEVSSHITPRSDNELDYLTFGQLGEIITTNFDVFDAVLTSKQAVVRVLAQLNMLRSPIAHCCVLAEDEKDRLALAVKDWFRLRS